MNEELADNDNECCDDSPRPCKYCGVLLDMDGCENIDDCGVGTRFHYIEDCRYNLKRLLDESKQKVDDTSLAAKKLVEAMELVRKYISCGSNKCIFEPPHASKTNDKPCTCLTNEKGAFVAAMAKVYRERDSFESAKLTDGEFNEP